MVSGEISLILDYVPKALEDYAGLYGYNTDFLAFNFIGGSKRFVLLTSHYKG